MSVDLRVTHSIAASPMRVWEVLVDWSGQRRWIPFTTVRVIGRQDTGVGVRCEALSGIWLRRLPLGLLDRFVVTAWRPPVDGGTGLLEVLHTGPYFRGPGSFELRPTPHGTEVRCAEIVAVTGGALPTGLARLTLPLLRAGFARSLKALGRLSCAGR